MILVYDIMLLRICSLLCALFLIGGANAFIKRDVSNADPAPVNVAALLQKNLENLRHCLDQSLATAVGGVNEKHLQPAFTAIGDKLNRLMKAFDDLTATTKSPDKDLDF